MKARKIWSLHTAAVIFKSEWEEKDWFRFGYGYGETHGKLVPLLSSTINSVKWVFIIVFVHTDVQICSCVVLMGKKSTKIRIFPLRFYTLNNKYFKKWYSIIMFRLYLLRRKSDHAFHLILRRNNASLFGSCS